LQEPQSSASLDLAASDIVEDTPTTPITEPDESTLSNSAPARLSYAQATGRKTQKPTRLSYAQAARQKKGSEKTAEPEVVQLKKAPADQPSEDHQNPLASHAETVVHEQSDSPILRTEYPRGDWAADHAFWETTLTAHFGWTITIHENDFERFREPLWILTQTRAQMLTFDRLALREHFKKLREFLLREFRKTGWARKIHPSSKHPLLLLYPGDIENLSRKELLIILNSRRPQDLMEHSQLWPQLSPGQQNRISLWSKNQWQPDAK